jgi:hypothetical protein
MGRSAITIIALLLLCTGAAASTEEADRAKTEPALKPDASNELVCRREPVLGSHMTRRVCRTRAQMETERAAAVKLIRSIGNSTVKPQGER